MNYVYAGLTLFGFAAPSAVMGVAYSIGTNGIVLGSIACIILTIASAIGSILLLASIQLCGARTKMYGDIGQVAFGERGAIVGNFIQQTNFLLFLPVALRLCADAAQGVFDPDFSICTDYFIIAVAVVCYIITQLRTLDNSKYLTAGSLICVFIAAILEIVIVNTHENDDKEEAWAFGNPDGDTEIGVFKALLGVTTAAWSYVPSFLVVELWNTLPNHKELTKGVILSAALNCVFYIGVGVAVVLAWEIDSWPATNAMSRIMNLLVLLANFVTYALSSLPFVRYCQLKFAPDFPVEKWTYATISQYAMISLPSFIFAVVLAIVIPNLFVMLAIVTALTVPAVTQIYPAACFLALVANEAHPTTQNAHQVEVERYRGLLVDDRRTDKSLGNKSHNDSLANMLNAFDESREGRNSMFDVFAFTDKYRMTVAAKIVLAIGVVNFVICFVAAIGKLAYDELRGESSIGCSGWMLYDTD